MPDTIRIKTLRRAAKLLVLALASLLLLSCGYSVIKSSGIDSVSIGRIENLTSEAGVEDRLMRILAEEITKNGIRIDQAAEHVIEGSIKGFFLNSLSETNELATTYELVVQGVFTLVYPDGRRRDLPGGGKYIVTFSSVGSLKLVLAYKQRATETALRNMSEEIAASLLYIR